MSIMIEPFSSVELGRRFNKAVHELAYAMGADLDLGAVTLGRSGTLVLQLIAIDPARGAVPNGTHFRRSEGELTSAINIDYARYIRGDLAEQLDCICKACLDALHQTPRVWLSGETRRAFEGALANARQRLLAEPDRLNS